MTSRTATKTYHQNRVQRYVALTVCLVFVTALWGTVHLFKTSQVAYQIQNLENNASQVNQQITQLESQYYVQTQEIDIHDASFDVVAYSPASQNVRYAHVGGAVYSLLSMNR